MFLLQLQGVLVYYVVYGNIVVELEIISRKYL